MAHTGYIGMNDNDIMLGELRQGQAPNIQFPNACLSVTIANALGSQSWWIANVNRNGFQFNFGASFNAIYWRAFGY